MTMVLKVRKTCGNRPVAQVRPMLSVQFKDNAIAYSHVKPAGEKVPINSVNWIERSKLSNDRKQHIIKSVVREEFDPEKSKPEVPIFYAIITYFSVLILLPFFGKLQDWLRQAGYVKRAGEHNPTKDTLKFPNLYQSYEAFFIRNIYARVQECWNRPICGVPGRTVDLVVRKPLDPTYKIKYEYPGTVMAGKLNLASYNYLGFADTHGVCANAAVSASSGWGVSGGSSEMELGRMKIHNDLERQCAEFLGVDEAMCFGMGFATNSMNIPCLVNGRSLIISDACNHASIITGCRLSGATIRTFKHNDMNCLEGVLRNAVLNGNPKRMNRPWNKILIIVEGIYSMEGTICNLARVVELKKKYNAYVYLDEAHSIGALGATGRGCCEYWGVDPRDIDIMMGTFTKSFGAAGGYIGGERNTINHLRSVNHGSTYAPTMSPPVAAQAMSALHMVGYTEEGHEKIAQLAKNAEVFRQALRDYGFCVYGDGNSPVVPVLTMEIGKMERLSHLFLEQGIAVVVVGFPATPVCENRVRFCLSSAHTNEDIQKALEIIKSVGDEVGVTYMKNKTHTD